MRAAEPRGSATVQRLFVTPVRIGQRVMPPPGLVALATVGALLLLVVATNRWSVPSDEHAYWLAARRLLDGQPLYDPQATPITPYAYWYPPVLAQALAPIVAVVPAWLFSILWTLLLLGCLWYLADRQLLVMLALIALPPVAIELWFRNVHLVLAVLVVAALRGGPDGRPWLWPIGAAIKLAPGLGIPWLAARERWRAVAVATAVGLGILAVSVVLSADAWRQWVEIVTARGPAEAAGVLQVPYLVRAVAGLVLALVAGRLRDPAGSVLLVVAITLALPTLWVDGLSLLVAIVPIWRNRPKLRTRVTA